MVVVILTAAV